MTATSSLGGHAPWILRAALALAVFAGSGSTPAHAGSLRFHGNGVDDIDRVKIRIDDPANSLPGPPADVGAEDFTIELWIRAFAAENTAEAVGCGDNIAWIFGNILLDRDRYNQDRKFGLSIAGGVPVFGVSGDQSGDHTVCGTTNVLDAAWHHVAIQRRRADGWMWLFVDGQMEASELGPDGDVSYPDAGVPGNHCGGPCVNSDPFLVIAAEKHDAGPSYPSYSGWVDELRLSNALRYAASFTPASQPFTPDAATVALYHLDEGAGDAVTDASGHASGPSPGVRRFGGTPAGPEWSVETPFGIASAGPRGISGAPSLAVRPNPSRGGVTFVARGEATSAPAVLEILDVTGRRVATLTGRTMVDGIEFTWTSLAEDGRRVSPGVYLARLLDVGSSARLVVLDR